MDAWYWLFSCFGNRPFWQICVLFREVCEIKASLYLSLCIKDIPPCGYSVLEEWTFEIGCLAAAEAILFSPTAPNFTNFFKVCAPFRAHFDRSR
jgi:hypothetical protein